MGGFMTQNEPQGFILKSKQKHTERADNQTVLPRTSTEAGIRRADATEKGRKRAKFVDPLVPCLSTIPGQVENLTEQQREALGVAVQLFRTVPSDAIRQAQRQASVLAKFYE